MSDTNIDQQAESVFGSIYQFGYVTGDVNITVQEALKLLPSGVAAPEVLFGREALVNAVLAALHQGGPSLLTGLAGMGKTSAAAEIAARWLAEKTGVLWVTAGRDARLPAILNSIALSFGPQAAQAMAAAERLNDKLNVTRGLLKRASLFVLDDLWDANVLAALLEQALPPDLPTLFTGRTVFTRIPKARRFDVTRLERPAALALLGHHAEQDYGADSDADALCKTLGDHPYALVIAGATLNNASMTLARLRRHIADAPHDLAVPEEFGALPERESIAALLRASVEALPAEARRALAALGALFAPQATPELVAMVLNQVSIGDSDPPPSPDVPTGWIDAAADALDTLTSGSLAHYVAATQYCAPCYAFHDLTYAYARASVEAPARAAAINACVAYAHRHARRPDTPEGVADHNALEAELPNLLNGATWAAEHSMPEAVNALAWALYASSLFLSVRGRAAEAVALLQLAVEAARALGLRRDEGAHTNHLGSAHVDLSRYNDAITHFEHALSIAREGGDRSNEGNALGNLGTVYEALGDYRRAIDCYEQALIISRTTGKQSIEANQLGNLGNIFLLLGDFRRAASNHEQALVIRRALGDRRGEGKDLGNLGLAYLNLNEYPRAIAFFEQALAIWNAIGDQRSAGKDLGNLGIVYATIRDFRRAIPLFEQALETSKAADDQRNAGNQLGNLGIAYSNLGQFRRAIEHLSQQLEIAQSIGDRLGEANALSGMGTAHARLEEYPQAAAAYTRARALYAAMGMQHRVQQVTQDMIRMAGL